MGRLARTSIAAALAALAVAALSSCGEEDAKLLPGETAREITANLDSVQQLADEGDCLGAESAAMQVSEQIEALSGVDQKLKQALRDGANRLNEVVDECEGESEEAVAPAEIPTEEENEEEPDRAAAKKEEKEEEKAEKKQEKEERKEEKAPPPAAAPPSGEQGPPETPPGQTPPAQEEAPSGGVEPASPVEGQQGQQ